MKVLVCGGRNFEDRSLVFNTLDRLHAERGIDFLIEGGAKGADRLAYAWALDKGMQHRCYPADWNAHGKGAGPIRNRHMLADGNPDVVVAFPGGSGTAHMMSIARAAGVEVIQPALSS